MPKLLAYVDRNMRRTVSVLKPIARKLLAYVDRFILHRRVFTWLIVLQAGLIVTGGIVRLTKSGLGCPTWPTCTTESYVPVKGQLQGALHSWIEFGNRLLTFVLVIGSLLAIATALRLYGRRKPRYILIMTLLQFIGILGQGVLGGITVLTKLNPIPVAGHFLLSIVLVAGAISLRQRAFGRESLALKATTQYMSKILVALTGLVLVVGTVVTGSGPHAGDIQAPRTGFDPAKVALLHGDLVIALISLTIGLLLVIRVSENDPAKKIIYRAVAVFLFVSLAQGFIGYVQYFTALPELLVGAHLLGSTLVWGAVWRINLLSPSIRK